MYNALLYLIGFIMYFNNAYLQALSRALQLFVVKLVSCLHF
jgi:hypothetical protein